MIAIQLRPSGLSLSSASRLLANPKGAGRFLLEIGLEAERKGGRG